MPNQNHHWASSGHKNTVCNLADRNIVQYVSGLLKNIIFGKG